jgi:hypothetical protein
MVWKNIQRTSIIFAKKMPKVHLGLNAEIVLVCISNKSCCVQVSVEKKVGRGKADYG